MKEEVVVVVDTHAWTTIIKTWNGDRTRRVEERCVCEEGKKRGEENRQRRCEDKCNLKEKCQTAIHHRPTGTFFSRGGNGGLSHLYASSALPLNPLTSSSFVSTTHHSNSQRPSANVRSHYFIPEDECGLTSAEPSTTTRLLHIHPQTPFSPSHLCPTRTDRGTSATRQNAAHRKPPPKHAPHIDRNSAATG